MAPEPQLRASLLRLHLRNLESARPDDAGAVREALGAEAVARIERTPGHEWLPVALEVAIVRTRLGVSCDALLDYGGVAAESELEWEPGAPSAVIRVRWWRGG